MRFAMLIYETPAAFASRVNDDPEPYRAAWRVYYRAMIAAGVHVGGDPLDLPHTGATVRVADGRRHVQDGPYADTKEQLAGVAFLEVPSLAEAIAWAGRCPAAAAGAVEVRPLAPEAGRRITETP
ncbi:MAG TPA: YciI family protein [Vicinamibacterales bacterium]|nr:YciI family protein [Vicinamibacterales bacterium]